MGLKVEGLFLPNKEIISYTVSPTVTAVAANSIMVACGDDVDLNRQVEIINAWKMLRDGVRDRNLFATWGPSLLYTAVDIDEITIPNRRTASETTAFTTSDVYIGLSAEVMGLTNEYLLMLDTAFAQLADIALEEVLKGT